MNYLFREKNKKQIPEWDKKNASHKKKQEGFFYMTMNMNSKLISLYLERCDDWGSINSNYRLLHTWRN